MLGASGPGCQESSGTAAWYARGRHPTVGTAAVRKPEFIEKMTKARSLHRGTFGWLWPR